MRRRTFSAALLAAAVAAVLASTAYACVVTTGDATVDGAIQDTNLLTGDQSHGFCTGRSPTQAARGAMGSTVGVTVAAATACNGSGTNVLPQGNYEVRLRNASAWTGSDSGGSWSQVAGSGCFRFAVSSTNVSLGTLVVGSNGSGSGSWSLPSSGFTNNGLTDASIFCYARRTGVSNTGPGAGTEKGMLAPFRVATS